jgi:hypothetical protein
MLPIARAPCGVVGGGPSPPAGPDLSPVTRDYPEGWGRLRRPDTLRILPGDRGTIRSGWWAWSPCSGSATSRAWAAFTSSSGDGRTSPSATEELRGEERSEAAPSRVSRPGWFRVRTRRSHPRGARLLLRASTGESTLARHPSTRCAPDERRRKAGQKERFPREARCHGRAPVSATPAMPERHRWPVRPRQPER